MSKTIEFNSSPSEVKREEVRNYNNEYTPAYRDITLRGDYWKFKQKFTTPTTWLRVLPSIRPSEYSWLLEVDLYKDKNGVTFASPNTFDKKAVNPFYQAAAWLKKNRSELLSNKDTNPTGLKMYPSKIGIAWVVDGEAEEGSRLRIFTASVYDGSRGGTLGLGYSLKTKADETDLEPGSPTFGQKIHGDITEAKSGRLIKIDRTKSEKAEFASYQVGIGKSEAPVEEYLKKLTDAEHELLEPLENIVYIPTEEEVHEILRNYIGEEVYNQIFPNRL